MPIRIPKFLQLHYTHLITKRYNKRAEINFLLMLLNRRELTTSLSSMFRMYFFVFHQYCASLKYLRNPSKKTGNEPGHGEGSATKRQSSLKGVQIINLFLDLIYEQCKQKLCIRGKLTSSLYRKRYLARERSLFCRCCCCNCEKKKNCFEIWRDLLDKGHFVIVNVCFTENWAKL